MQITDSGLTKKRIPHSSMIVLDLCELRTDLGFSKAKFAKKIHLPYDTYIKMERRGSVKPEIFKNIKNLLKIKFESKGITIRNYIRKPSC
jgi:DNA-binding XRE family transcriptional regulator